MEGSFTTLFPSGSLIMDAYPFSDLHVHVAKGKTPVQTLDRLMDMDWTIMATWIQDEDKSIVFDNTVIDVSIRLGMEDERIILLVDLPLAVAYDVVENIDADIPGDNPAIITGMKNSISKLRAVSISGYGPYATRGVGLKKPAKMPKLSIIGLDIEVSTVVRGDGMPLPHDPLISISISNGGWYDKEFKDKCYLIYTFGYHTQAKWEDGRYPVILKAENDTDAVRKAYEILDMLSPDFVSIHNGFNFDLRSIGCKAVGDIVLDSSIEERRLGNVGVGVFWALTNGVMVVDTMYTADKTSRSEWGSFALDKMCRKFDLPSKLDSGTMRIPISEDVDLTQILVYNARDSDMHAWLAKRMTMCERIGLLAGSSRSTLWDSVANNTGVMTFCLMQSVALSNGEMLDLGRNTMSTEDQKFEGGYVVPPRPGVYKGVIMIDGNSLYGSLMSKLQIFIDRCASGRNPTELQAKVDVDLPEEVHLMPPGDVIWNERVIVMRTKRSYIAVVQGGPTMLSKIIDRLIQLRKIAKANGDDITSWTFKILLVSIYGAMGSKHGIMASKTCAEATTCAGRFFVRNMIEVVEEEGCEVIYGDTDSIFAWVKGTTEEECMDMATKLKKAIERSLVGTPFEEIGADVKGNYKTILITARKKYAVVDWNDEMETKGMTPVKKDTLPIARYAASKVLNIVTSEMSHDGMKKNITMFLGKLLMALQNNKLPAEMQVTETKINCQPHYKYKATNGERVSVLVDTGLDAVDVHKGWVLERITGAVKTILEAADMGTVRGLIFSYNMIMKQKRGTSSDKATSVIVE
jgi:DNA polymerase elongation subunit (family B)